MFAAIFGGAVLSNGVGECSPFSLHGLWLSRMGQPATQNGVGEVRLGTRAD